MRPGGIAPSVIAAEGSRRSRTCPWPDSRERPGSTLHIGGRWRPLGLAHGGERRCSATRFDDDACAIVQCVRARIRMVKSGAKTVLKSSTAQHAKPCRTSPDPRIRARLTGRSGSGKFERLPRCAAGRWRVGVRAILENSTACQKSMPSLISFLWGGFWVVSWVRVFFGWIELSQFGSFCTAGISYPSGFVFPFTFWGVGV